MNFDDDLRYLGTRYFSLVRAASRRDLEEAEAFFGLPTGQVGYVMGSLTNQDLELLSGYGLPYAIGNQVHVLSSAAPAHLLANHREPELSGWHKTAYELAQEHWWIARDWARRDLGLAALLLGIKGRAEAEVLMALEGRHIRPLAAATYMRMHMDGSLGMQTAILLTDAQAAPDRLTVARCSSPILSLAA